MDDQARLRDLKAFLRARRAALTPAEAGLPDGPRRRLKGLRREEVASLAEVGVTWYTWLEQGRPIRVSRDALMRIARALRLSSTDTEYLFTLAGASDVPDRAALDPRARLQLAVDSFDRTPAFAIDPMFNTLVFNRLADRLHGYGEWDGPFPMNCLLRLFADPRRASLYDKLWDRVATHAVGVLRANYPTLAADPEFQALLKELREFTGFRQRWDAQYTAEPTSQLLVGELYRKDLGRLNVHFLRLVMPELPGHVLFALPPADDDTAARFRRLCA